MTNAIFSKNKLRCLIMTVPWLLMGCGALVRSEYQPPEVTIPANWQQHTVSAQVRLDPWWQRFKNPRLNQLVEQVLATNNDLLAATLTLRQARLQAGLTRDQLFPQVSANLSGSRSKPLTGGESQRRYSGSLSVSYEADLWGRVGADVDSAEWSALATKADRESTAQSLVVTTASLYWQTGYLHDRLALSQKSIDYARKTLALTTSQYQSGAVSRLNVLEAKRSLSGQLASHNQLQQQLIEAQNALAILFNQPPEQQVLTDHHLPAVTTLPPVAAGIPADLLVRRPDVKAALYRLRSSLAAKDATFAGYFPQVSLTGSIGTGSDQLLNILRDPVGALGAGITLPFLQWNQMQLNKKLADISYQQSVVSYRSTLYQALSDVENALSARRHYQYQQQQLQQQYDAATAAEKIYESQYRSGAVSIQDWLSAQEQRRSAEAELLANRYNLLTSQATLYQALGGTDMAPPLNND